MYYSRALLEIGNRLYEIGRYWVAIGRYEEAGKYYNREFLPDPVSKGAHPEKNIDRKNDGAG